MLTLYHAPFACSLAVRFALAETEHHHHLVVVDLTAEGGRPDALKRISPGWKVPALELDRGTVTENAAILTFLADDKPEAELLPLDPFDRAQAASWLAWMSSTLHPSFTRCLRPERFTTSANDVEAVRASAVQAVRMAFDRVDAHLAHGAWLLPKRSVCDLYLLVFTLWRRNPLLADKLPVFHEIDRWQGQMLARPALAACIADDMRLLAAQRRDTGA